MAEHRLISTLLRFILPFALIIWSNGVVASMVAFFPVETKTCPSGWSIYKPAQGFVIRGTDDNAIIGQRLGSAIEDGRGIKHHHDFSSTISFKDAIYLVRTGTDERAHGKAVTVKGVTGEGNISLPFVQYLVCQENKGRDHSPYLPKFTVQWFSGDSCPADWEVFKPATQGSGHTLLPLPVDAQASDSGAVVGTNSQLNHSHPISIRSAEYDRESDDVLRVDMKKIETRWDLLGFLMAFTNRNFAVGVNDTNDETLTGQRIDSADAKNDPLLVPFTYLRPCIKKSDSRQIKRLPSGIGAFTTGYDCPSGLTRVSSAPGRYLVGLPQHHSGNPFPESGKVFGGAALQSKQHRVHKHHINLDFKADLETSDSTGIIRPFVIQGFTRGATLKGQTGAVDITFPYVQLRFCFNAN